MTSSLKRCWCRRMCASPVAYARTSAPETRPPGPVSWTGRPGLRLQQHGAGPWIVGGHEHGRDDEVHPRRYAAEVDERRLQLVRRAQRPVVRLVDRPCAVGVGEERARFVEGVGVRVLERGRHRERRGPALLAPAMVPRWNEPKLTRAPSNVNPSRSLDSGTRSS
jgi:hypothetical protein